MNGSASGPRPIARLAFWLLPLAFCLWVHWYGIKCWFQSDDFAWLGLHRQVYDLASFGKTLFAPAAQGTIRPWSERGFFLLFHYFFGMDALPYRIWVFLTQFANLLLLTWIVRKTSGSRWAALWAAILWTANTGLAIPMSWSSDYNQILCAFFLLAAFALYLAGRYWLQFVVFVLGFGALEVNVVYPAILIAWLLTSPPHSPGTKWFQRIKPALPLAAVSGAYYVLHSAVAPRQVTGLYALHWDASIFHTLWVYWSWTFVPDAWSAYPEHPAWAGALAVGIGTLAAGYFTLRTGLTERNRLPLFFVLWFCITIAPVLPLRDHLTDYYVTLPSLGLAAVLGLALTRRTIWAGAAAAAYLLVQTPTARATCLWYYGRGREVRTLVLGVQAAHDRHPKQSLLLSGISANLYNMSLAHSAFYALGIDRIYLAPDTPTAGIEDPTLLPEYILTGEPLLRGLADEQIQVYAPDAGRLRNVTAIYESSAIIK